MNPQPVMAAAPEVCARAYHLPLRRLLNAINRGECQAPYVVGRRHILTFAAVEKYLEYFPIKQRRIPHADRHDTSRT